MKKFISLSIMLIALACTPQQKNYNVVDTTHNNCIELYAESHGTFKINTAINGVLVIPFMLDTGASDISVSPQVFLTLIETGTIDSEDMLSSQTYVLADGSKVVNKRFIIRRLKIGKFVLTDLEASVGNTINSPMLLGQNALSKLGVFTIDYEKNLMCVKSRKVQK